jgi:selenocysteine lyase/cysteine desulfurase
MEQLLGSYIDISVDDIKNLVYRTGIIKTPFLKRTYITYADYIASGKPSPIIENYLIKKIYPYYSNTHSNAYCGIHMKNLIKGTKDYIRKQFKINEDYQIIFSNSGTTGCINHLVHILDYSQYETVIIYLSLYEHYSNYLPWKELSNTYPSKIKVIIIPFMSGSGSGIIDLEWFKQSLQKQNSTSNKTLIICSIIACSNINGIVNPLDDIRNILDTIIKSPMIYKYFFADYACSAPYVEINGKILDAFMFSPHKFIGGIETPGILIARACLFNKTKPYCSGGGCVKKASSKIIEYEQDIETRESAGTPNIIGIIKIGKVLELKEKMFSIIANNEHHLSKLIKYMISYYESKYPTFRSVLYNDNVKHLPILSFSLSDLHYNLIVVLFNDLFGIQTRGGIGCCGLLAEYIENSYNYRGWCRI